MRRVLLSVLAVAALLPATARADTYTVTSAADDGPGTLRRAISDSNFRDGADVIEFNIGAGGPQAIVLDTALPPIADSLRLDASTQPGYSSADRIPMIEVTAPSGPDSLFAFFGGGAGEVRGFAFHGDAGVAVNVGFNTGPVKIAANFFQTNREGTAWDGTRFSNAINMNSGAIVGGPTVADRNVFACPGLCVVAFGAPDATIQNNFIGIDRTGSTLLTPSEFGIGVYVLASAGLSTSAIRVLDNVIAGEAYGVKLSASGTETIRDVTVARNVIGLDAAGATALGIDQVGVELVGAVADTTITGNVIGDVRGPAISLSSNDGAMRDITIEGNRIGAGPDGSAAFPYFGHGVYLAGVRRVTIRANTIVASNSTGVRIERDASGVLITRNAIRENSFGISLGSLGPTPNDPLDGDELDPLGLPLPNHLQNFPVMGAAGTDGAHTQALITLNSRPGRDYDIELFDAGACDASGNGEGATYLATYRVRTDAAGDARLPLVLGPLSAGTVLTATATDVAERETSEFSNCAVVADGLVFRADLSVTAVHEPANPTAGEGVTFRYTVRNAGPAIAPNATLTATLPAQLTITRVPGGCTIAAPVVTCALGNLADGESRTVDVEGFMRSPGVATTSATAGSDEPDPQPGDNEARHDMTVNVAPDPPPELTPQPTVAPTTPVAPTPAPTAVAGRSVVAAPASGAVTVKVPGSNTYVPLASLRSVPVGASVDATKGAVRLTNAAGESAVFSRGRFTIRAVDGFTELVLDGPLPTCAKKQARAAGKKPKPPRDLFADGKGKYRVRGKYGSGAIRGTKWLTSDRCDGTLFKVSQGVVTVVDFTRGNKTIVVRKGKQYLARARG